MKPFLRPLEWITRPSVVLGLRVAWDFGFGMFLLLVAQGILAYRSDVLIIGAGTVAVGAWTLAAMLRVKKGTP